MLSAKLSRYDILSQQEKLMRYTIRKGAQTSPWIQTQLKRAGLTPDDIRGKEDLAKIPFTTKQDLRDNYPFGMLACPLEDVVRFHASSGTTGKSTVVYYTQQDIDTWAGLMARVLQTTGLTNRDIMQIIYNYGFFTGGFGFHYGAERLGVSVIPSGSGNTKRQIEIMRDFKTTSFTSTPSYALHLAEVAREMDVEPSSLSLRQGVFGGEPWSEAIRRQIETAFGIDAYDNYGLSELCGPGVACECEEKDGLHVWEDYFILEVIDPETGEVLADGEKGELVFTPLWKQAMPLLRYRTGDISRIMDDECGCSLPFKKVERITGRSDDMLIIRGVNIFPSQIEEVISQHPAFRGHYQIVVEKQGAMDALSINMEVTDSLFSGNIKDLLHIQKDLQERIRSTFFISADVKLVEEGSIPRSIGKAQRVIDKRGEQQ
ncbi:MAG: phenylacetate--CoA ligase [Candidatus Methanofastidiosa archaeon]|nr:phenylacetate--CoA ligase [Candidatus Methanofastidiosa archaeon]